MFFCCAAQLTSRNFYPKRNEIGADRTVEALASPSERSNTKQIQVDEAKLDEIEICSRLFYVRFDFSLRHRHKRPQSTQIGFSRACKWAFFSLRATTLYLSIYSIGCLGRKNPWEFWFYRRRSELRLCAGFKLFSQNLCVAGGSSFRETSSIYQNNQSMQKAKQRWLIDGQFLLYNSRYLTFCDTVNWFIGRSYDSACLSIIFNIFQIAKCDCESGISWTTCHNIAVIFEEGWAELTDVSKKNPSQLQKSLQRNLG